MVRTEVHLSIRGMSRPYLCWTTAKCTSGESCNLRAVRLKISSCIVIIKRWMKWKRCESSFYVSTQLKEVQRLTAEPKKQHSYKKKECSENVAPSRQLNSIQVYAKLSISRNGFSYRSAKLWNGLPEHLRKLTCMKKFKIEVKDWVRSFVPVKPEWRTQDEHPKMLI